MNRRDVIKTGAAGLAVSMFAPHVAGAADEKTYRVGLIGAGWYGKNDLMRLIQVAPVEVVSICDVDKHQAAEAAEWTSQRQKSKKTPRTYGDYRRMLKEKDLDIVLIGTPDHWHALCAIAAMEAGADLYCQKPISRDVLEGEAMVAAARKHNKVVQVGTQRKLGAAPARREEERHRGGVARQDRAGRYLLLLSHAGQREPARVARAGLLRLRDVDRPRPAAAVRQAAARSLVANVYGIRQRDHGGHVRPHARPDAVHARAAVAKAGHVERRHLRR